MLMTYGYAPASVDDPVIKAADEGAKIFGSLFQFNGTLINIFPILRHIPAWVPGATSQKQIKRLKWLTDEAKRIPLEHVKAAMVSKVNPPEIGNLYTAFNRGKGPHLHH